MKNYMVSLSKRALLLNDALAIFTACDGGNLGDIYKDNSSSEYVSDVNWTDAADENTGIYIKHFYENASGQDTFCGSIYWEKPSTPEIGEPASTGGSGGWPQGHALDIAVDAYICHTSDLEYQAHSYENIMKPFLPVLDNWSEYCSYGGKDFWNNSYDDMEQMALSCLRAYELVSDQDYYSTLMKMQNHIKGVKSDYKGIGGMVWKTDTPASRMFYSNGPGHLLAMKLYRLTVKEAEDGREEQAAHYLNSAKEVYSWMTAYPYDISTGRVHDNLSIKDDGISGDPDKVVLSYNQGTFTTAVLKLYNATGEDEYSRNAIIFGSHQMNRKMDSDYLIFSGEGNLGNNLLFHGIFVRYFLGIVKQPTNGPYSEKTKSKFIAALRSYSDILQALVHPEGYYVWEYDQAKAPTFGNRDNKENHLTISPNAEVPEATATEIRVRYEDWVQGKATEEANWVGPDFGKKTEK